MKKLIAIAAALLIGSGLYAKQYIYSLKANATVLRYSTAQKLQEGLERALFDLIIRGNKSCSKALQKSRSKEPGRFKMLRNELRKIAVTQVEGKRIIIRCRYPAEL